MTEQTDVDDVHVPTPDELLDDVLTDVSKHLQNLYSWMPLVRERTDTQRDPAYIPRSTREQLGRQHADRYAGAQVHYGTDARGTRSAAPGNFGAMAMEADVEMTIRHLVKFAVRHQAELTGHVPGQETTEQLISRARSIFMRLDDLRIATAVAVDLEVLAETCRHQIFGEERQDLPSPCPYCGRRSLVVYLETGVIRCERTRDATGRAPVCRCHGRHDVDDQPCACRTQARFEHHWLRDRSGTHQHSWQALHAALIHHTKENS